MRATVLTSVKLDPIIATAIDAVREADGLSLSAYLARDPRVVEWFRKAGIPMPPEPKAGRPGKINQPKPC